MITLIIALWAAFVTVAFAVSCVQAAIHFLPAAAPAWEPPYAPTLAEERHA